MTKQALNKLPALTTVASRPSTNHVSGSIPSPSVLMGGSHEPKADKFLHSLKKKQELEDRKLINAE